MTWHKSRLTCFDLETTGKDPEDARIVTAAAVLVGGGEATYPQTWLVDPGMDIPAEATQVHGISTEFAAAEGMTAAPAVEAITEQVAAFLEGGAPLVIYNAPYDLTVLDRECRRHQLPTLDERIGRPVGPVVDPLVLDKHVDRYRKGKRTLEAACQHYQVSLDGAHDSSFDAVAAARVAYRICQRYPHIADLSPAELHELQTKAYAEHAASFQAYLRRGKDPHAEIPTDWPIRPYQAVAAYT